MNIHDLWLRLRALFFPGRVERDLQDEIEFHLEMQARRNASRGVSEEEARRQAVRRFGNVGSLAEECRDQRGVQLLDSLIRDIRYAWRQLRFTPAFTVIAVLSLALGIGANTALFTVFDSLYLRKVAAPRPDDLVFFRWRAFGVANPLSPKSVYGSMTTTSDGQSGREYTTSTSFAPETFEVFRNSPDVPAEVFAFAGISGSAEIDGWPRDVSAQVVSGNYFDALGVTTIAGRPIESADDAVSAAPVAVISQDAWETLFDSNPAAIGRAIVFNGSPVTIAGVVGRDFRLGDEPFPAFTLPKAFADRLSQGNLSRAGLWWLQLMARKTPQATIQQVEASLQGLFQGNVVAAASLSAPVASEQIPRLDALPGNRGFIRMYDGGAQSYLLTVAVVFAVLLLIVCLNLANLLTARAVSREYEIGMRLSLGASRLRLIRQLVTESLVLALLGGGAGALIAVWGKELLRSYLGQQIPMSVSWRVLVFNIAVAGVTGLLFGLAPAFRATRSRSGAWARSKVGNANPRKALVNRSLVVIQVAMSVVLLIGAGLMIQSTGNWKRIDLGFKPETLVIFDTQPPKGVRGEDLFDSIGERLRHLPGVMGVSTVGCFPPSSCGSGVQSADDAEIRRADVRRLEVPATFFQVVGSSFIAGRNFTASDAAESSRAAIIDEEFARRIFPRSSPIGRRFTYEGGKGVRELEVVGVVKNIVVDVGRPEVRPILYLPETAASLRYGTTFIIQIAGDPESVIPSIRRAVADVDSGFLLFGLTTFKQLMERDLSRQTQLSTIWMLFAGTALLLTAIGLYGLTAYTVSRRVNEIGLRIALGATGGSVLFLIMRQILRLVIVGFGAGLVLSVGLHQILRAYVFGVSAFDPLSFIAAATLVGTVTAIAVYAPARRGTRIDAVVALRCE